MCVACVDNCDSCDLDHTKCDPQACKAGYTWRTDGTCISKYIEIKVPVIVLTLKVLVATIDAQWEGMGDVGSARYEPALLPPCPTIRVLSYSN